jgi:hypothetical protein
MNTFILAKNSSRTRLIGKLTGFLEKLPEGKAWRVEVSEQKTKRSDSQNAYLWGVVYRTILDSEALQGWRAEDVHEYMCGEHFGWETLEGFGRKRLRPLRRSSKLSTTEFMDFISFIQQKMAELGIYIPDANEYRGVA